MIAKFAEYVGGKVVSAILILAVALTGYWFYQHPEKLQDLWQVIRGCLIWAGFVLALPWALFFLPGKAVKTESNLAAAALLIAYLVLDVLMALYLSGWHVAGALTWGVLVLGFLIAGVYNFWVCDFLAEQSEETL